MGSRILHTRNSQDFSEHPPTMVGVLHQVHSIKYTVDTCTGMPPKQYWYESDFSRLQPCRRGFLTMLNRFLYKKRISLQVYKLFKTNFIVNFLQRFVRNYIKCSNQYFHSRFYSPECHQSVF